MTTKKAPAHGPFAAKMPSGIWVAMLDGVVLEGSFKTRKEALEAAEKAQREAEDEGL